MSKKKSKILSTHCQHQLLNVDWSHFFFYLAKCGKSENWLTELHVAKPLSEINMDNALAPPPVVWNWNQLQAELAVKCAHFTLAYTEVVL